MVEVDDRAVVVAGRRKGAAAPEKGERIILGELDRAIVIIQRLVPLVLFGGLLTLDM